MIVGLTGGIGSGKSTVANIFRHLGVSVYEADQRSKMLLDSDTGLQQSLVDLLGGEILEGGKINRPRMAGKIFNDEQLLARANALIHPAVAEDFKTWYHEHQKEAYVIREAAILYESGSYQDCEKVIVVTAPEEMRIQRVMQRNKLSREEVLDRMKNQWPEQKKVARADYVIYNDHSRSVIKQVLEIHEDIVSQSNPGSR